MDTTRADQLRRAIAAATQRLAELHVETGQVRARLDALHAELTADVAATPQFVPPTQVASAAGPTPHSAANKVALFRRLFRGREDVYPVRFVSTKTGKAGYAPACRNKFIRGVCELPRVKCGACPNQAFMPADETAVLDHLQGRHVMGVYPLLPDDTCWFVAADFDGPGWIDAVESASAPTDVRALARRIFEDHPDPPDLPRREYDVHDARAARAAVRRRLGRGARS